MSNRNFGIAALTSLLVVGMSVAQVRVYDPKKKTERNVENRVNNRVDQGIDKGLDKVEEGIGNIFKKKDKNKPNKENSTETDASSAGNASETAKTGSGASAGTLKSYSRFDFVSGEKVVVMEDFSQDAIGDFPAKWNTNTSAEVVTLEGQTGRWLQLTKQGVFYPEFIQSLPDNFTLEFWLACTKPFSYYSGDFVTSFICEKEGSKILKEWGRFGRKTNGTELGLHPHNAGGGAGTAEFRVYDAEGHEQMKNDITTSQFHDQTANVVKVSIWRQKQRLRVYLNEEKVLDLPRAMTATTPYTHVSFRASDYGNTPNMYFIKDIGLAVGAADTRNKLLTEGKFVTTGILFDVNSARIKPESYGVLKEIGQVLKENPAIKVKIVGHTDADGDDASNLTLSRKRAEAVREALAAEFGIETARIQTDGKGESQPVGANTTAEGKANNRRVEFIKL